MNRFFFILISCFVTLFCGSANENSSKKSHNTHLSPTDIAVSENGLYIACYETSSIRWLTNNNYAFNAELKLPEKPKKICETTNKLYIAAGDNQGYLFIVDKKSFKVTHQISVGKGVSDIAITKDESAAYIANQFTDDISCVDLKKHKEIRRIKVLRQPFCLALSNDNKNLFVGNFITDKRSDLDYVSASISLIDLSSNIKIKDIGLSNGSNALRSMIASDDGCYIFVSHNLGRFQVPTTQLEQGWMNTSALSVINTKTLSHISTILLDQPERGAAGSWGVSQKGDKIVVAHSGAHDFSIIEYDKLKNKLKKAEDPDNSSYDLRFLVGMRKRVKVEGNGPRTIKIDGSKIIVANYFSDNLNIVNDSGDIVNINLNEGYTPDSIRLGEQYFNDATFCYQNWQSCNGCHPDNARVDGMNWDLVNDGTGNPKNCKSMLLAVQTPPSMASAIRANAKIAVRAGFVHIQFSNISDDVVNCVTKYIESLRPNPSPHLENGKLSAKAQKGNLLFKKYDCGSCHSGQYYTNCEMYEVDEIDKWDKTNRWDTPTLIETWRTAPYMHDGRYATMREVFSVGKHGINDTSTSEDDIDSITKYVLSL